MKLRGLVTIRWIGVIPVLLHVAAAVVAEEDRAGLGSEELERYFENRVAALEGPLDAIKTLEDWQEMRPLLRGQLLEMLGLEPMPERTALKAAVTGRVEREDVMVENVHFQSLPGLYVTGNYYAPRERDGKVPGILYVCGHARAKIDGVSYGNKASYHHHGVWFARNGYACLVIDTIQLGEIEGTHHWTYRHNRWWWNARGYTPAGVEAWNCIRALDYLQGRPEVDGERLGVTGRSGGGAYSWWIAAIDERVKAAVPVAGITSLRNHVVDGCVEGHCDCMFPVNTYRWDFEQVAALVAPRPLLISNSDKDRIFPLDGVYQVYRPVRRIYELHEAGGMLGLNIEEGPHKDTQPLRTSAFHWLNRHLKGARLQDTYEMAAAKCFEPQHLKVFEGLPEDEINTRIDQIFVAAAAAPVVPEDAEEWRQQSDAWMADLRKKCFRGWPTGKVPPKARFNPGGNAADGRTSRPGIIEGSIDTEFDVSCQVRIFPSRRDGQGGARNLVLRILADGEWESRKPGGEGARGKQSMAYFFPRGVRAGEWADVPKKRIHIRRRFALIGQTLDGMRVWDILQAVRALRAEGWGTQSLTIEADGPMAGNALYAALFLDEPVTRLVLRDLPSSHRDGPVYLNVLKVWDMPQAVAMAAEQSAVVLEGAEADPWSYARETTQRLGWPRDRFRIRKAE